MKQITVLSATMFLVTNFVLNGSTHNGPDATLFEIGRYGTSIKSADYLIPGEKLFNAPQWWDGVSAIPDLRGLIANAAAARSTSKELGKATAPGMNYRVSDVSIIRIHPSEREKERLGATSEQATNRWCIGVTFRDSGPYPKEGPIEWSCKHVAILPDGTIATEVLRTNFTRTSPAPFRPPPNASAPEYLDAKWRPEQDAFPEQSDSLVTKALNHLCGESQTNCHWYLQHLTLHYVAASNKLGPEENQVPEWQFLFTFFDCNQRIHQISTTLRGEPRQFARIP